MSLSVDLSWGEHIHALCTKYRETLGLMYRTLCQRISIYPFKTVCFPHSATFGVATPASWCGTLIILRNLRKCRSLLYVFVLNNGILIIRLFFLFLTSQHLPHGGNTLTSAQCSTLSTSCYTSLYPYFTLVKSLIILSAFLSD